MNQSFTPEIVEIESIKYLLNEKEKTAEMVCHTSNKITILIVPTSFTYKSQKYIITSIHPFAFKSLTQITSIQFLFNSQLQTIGDESFVDTSIESITIPPHVKTIGKGAFSNCTQLKQVIIPDNSELQIIEEYAFSHTKIQSFTIPRHLTKLGAGWCFGASRLTDIELHPENNNFQIYKNACILSKSSPSSDKYDVLHYFMSDIEKTEIPNFVRIIGPYCFSRCPDLQTIDFQPNSQVHTIGKGFIANTKIESITIPQKVTVLERGWLELTNFLKIVRMDDRNTNFSGFEKTFILGKTSPEKVNFDVLHFSNRDVKTVLIPKFIKVIGNSAFRICKSLNKLEFEKDSDLQIIDDYAFVSTNIEKVSIPKKVTYIGKGSFASCMNLFDVEIPEDLEIDSISELAFANTKIQRFLVPLKVEKIGNNAFKGCGELKKLNIFENSQLKTIEEYAFEYTKIGSLAIPHLVTNIDKRAFYCCYDLKIVQFDNTKFNHKNEFLRFMNKNTLIMIPKQRH